MPIIQSKITSYANNLESIILIMNNHSIEIDTELIKMMKLSDNSNKNSNYKYASYTQESRGNLENMIVRKDKCKRDQKETLCGKMYIKNILDRNNKR